jgi:hypothetical protein
MDVTFTDYKLQVLAALNELSAAVLEEAAGELEAQIKRNTAVDTGQTKNSWQHRVTNAGDKHEAQIGSDYENAIWEELGTGEYALHGNGRKGGWAYKDTRGDWHFTYGKHPRRPAHRAYTANRDKLIKFMQNKFKEGMK